MSNTILMGRDNPDGHKLEDLLNILVVEVTAKTAQIQGSEHPKAGIIRRNNGKIIELLKEARALQRETYRELDAYEPNRGPLNPRL